MWTWLHNLIEWFKSVTCGSRCKCGYMCHCDVIDSPETEKKNNTQ